MFVAYEADSALGIWQIVFWLFSFKTNVKGSGGDIRE